MMQIVRWRCLWPTAEFAIGGTADRLGLALDGSEGDGGGVLFHGRFSLQPFAGLAGLMG